MNSDRYRERCPASLIVRSAFAKLPLLVVLGAQVVLYFAFA